MTAADWPIPRGEAWQRAWSFSFKTFSKIPIINAPEAIIM